MRSDDDQRCLTAVLALAGDDEQARSDALGVIRALADEGHAEAQFRLGLHLARHGGDRAEAARWCQAAARQGHAAAQFNLGLLHADGHGVDQDAAAADRWLRLSAANGVPEAESCLELIHRDAEPGRPATWDEAETRASVALARTDPAAEKSLRFAEYYVDPCIDLLIRRCRLDREHSEEIVQQFFLEFEEPLCKGAYQGRPWKDSLRASYDPGRTRRGFRPFLGRVLENFARDWLRRERKEAEAVNHRPPITAPELEHAVEHHREDWQALLARFLAAVGDGRADAARAARIFASLLGEGLDQAEAGRRFAVGNRTVRRDLRFATELLLDWLRTSLAVRAALDPAIEAGLAQLPDWLHHPIGNRRTRALLFLALAERRLARGAPTADQGA